MNYTSYEFSRLILISSIIFFFELFSNLIKKSLSLPKFLTETSPRFILFKESLNEETFILLSEDLNSIKVPPLKSIPKLRPLKTNNKIEETTKITETKLNKL